MKSSFSISGPFSTDGWHSRGYLPHFESSSVVQSVTFRLGDSLPREAILRMEKEAGDDAELRKRLDAFMDAGHGACHLRRDDIAGIVEGRLLHGDGVRYRLHAWCIMPNHVHVMLHMLPGGELSSVVHAWKSVSARLSARCGISAKGFWQRDYWDRFIRDERHWMRCRDYIHENPVKAGLSGDAPDWRWSSAWRSRELSGAGCASCG